MYSQTSWNVKSRWALGSIPSNKAGGSNGIPDELFQILIDDFVNVLHSVCQQIWKSQQWPQNWKISLAKKRITTKRVNIDKAIGLPWYIPTQSGEPPLFTLSRAPSSVMSIFYILPRLYLTTSLSCRKIAIFALTTLPPTALDGKAGMLEDIPSL